jgi:hypothetical protein
MNHDKVDQLFEKYLNGELNSKTAAELETHIQHCPDCAGRYAGFLKISKGLSSIGDEPFPVDFHDRWTKSIASYGRRHKNTRKRPAKLLPAIAAVVAAVAVVSVVALSGVLAPAADLSEDRLMESAEYGVAAGEGKESTRDSIEAENEQAAPPESASLFMAQEAPEMSEESSTEESSAEADKIAVPLYVTSATFEALKNLLIDQGADFCLDEGLMIVSVTEENQDYLTGFADEYALGISPLPGETYEIWLK